LNVTTDVLIVGAGPTGLALACELLRRGVRARCIDQLAEPVVYSKAAVVHARTMELLDGMEVAEPLLAHARTLHGTNVFAGGKRIVHIALDGQIDSPYPAVYGVSQHDTEQVLAARLAQLGGRVERGVRLDGFAQDAEGVTAKLSTGEEVRAGWLVGCDGAHSTVRKQLRFSFEGGPYAEHLIQTDVRVELARAHDDDEILVFLDERGPAMLFPLFRDGRYRVILFDVGGMAAPADAPPPPEPTLDDFRRGLAARGIDAKLDDPAWMVAFHIHHRHVDRLRDGRVFLAGDAAHIHSPVGGQGMNTGIQDAVNLGWKLALAATGRALPAVLDSYEAERLPVIRELVAGTDRATRAIETAVRMRNPITRALRDQLMSIVTRIGAVQTRAISSLTMLGIGYPESPLCAQDRPALWSANVVASGPTENPSVRDWAAFGEGPAPGARAPDACAQGGLGGGPVHVHELLRRGRHVALLFDGATASEAGYANLVGIARALQSRFEDLVEPYLVVPMTAPLPAARWEGPTLLDPGGEVHQRYGARSECVYVLRPDGYIGYRSQPADRAKLERWLASFLTD
jgi:2-polyprenyl-6-methoxyphenol hydroxylase-like FAD-dependent oxidoreductase